MSTADILYYEGSDFHLALVVSPTTRVGPVFICLFYQLFVADV